MDGQKLYRAGLFRGADSAYRLALQADPLNREALAGAGSLALLNNRLEEAEASLTRALDHAPDDVRLLQELAEVAYRQDDFAAAAGRWRQVSSLAGGGDQTHGMVAKLESFKGLSPYRVEGDRQAWVPLEFVDPLPVLNVRLNNEVTVPFFIDTGGHEVFVDQAVGESLGLPVYGSSQIIGAGGKPGAIGHGRLSTLTLGDMHVHDLPVHTLDLSETTVGGVAVKGVIGTAFLYHFCSTIDYLNGALILRPKDQTAVGEVRHVIDFWLSGSHFVLARGSVNNSDPMLMFVDTGGTGIGFTGPMSTIEAAGGITLRHDDAYIDHGAGGSTRVIPFDVDRLTLGDVVAGKVKGVFLPDTDDFLPDSVHEFPVGGIVSHEFFRNYALTFDFVNMRLLLS